VAARPVQLDGLCPPPRPAAAEVATPGDRSRHLVHLAHLAATRRALTTSTQPRRTP
jgi:hypothetical protein